jgi:enoyl-CoA hydratase
MLVTNVSHSGYSSCTPTDKYLSCTQCDMIFASNSSRFGLPEVSIGLLPGAGGTQRLTNVVGKFKAMNMILLGTPISAEEAKSVGLVAELFESGQVLEHVLQVASKLASMSPMALSLAKEAVCRG